MLAFLESLDIFGHAIKLNYKGEDTYKSKLGGFCILDFYALSIFSLVTLSIAFQDNSKMDSSVQKNSFAPFYEDAFSLKDYQMEIISKKSRSITPNIGRTRFFQNNNCMLEYGETVS